MSLKLIFFVFFICTGCQNRFFQDKSSLKIINYGEKDDNNFPSGHVWLGCYSKPFPGSSELIKKIWATHTSIKIVTFKNGMRGIFKFEEYSIDIKEANIAAISTYNISELIGFYNLTPPIVERTLKIDGKDVLGTMQYLNEDFLNAHRYALYNNNFNEVCDAISFLDMLVANLDRHNKNFMINRFGRQIAVDHARTFKPKPRVKTHIRGVIKNAKNFDLSEYVLKRLKEISKSEIEKALLGELKNKTDVIYNRIQLYLKSFENNGIEDKLLSSEDI